MPSPSKSWTDIVDTQIDADSPLDTTLLTAIRDDLVHIKEWLGKDYAASTNHSHDGADSVRLTDGNITKTGGIAVFDDFLLSNIDGRWTNVVSAANSITGVCGALTVAITPANGPGGVHSTGNSQFSSASNSVLVYETRYKNDGTSNIPVNAVLGFSADWLSTGPGTVITFEAHSGGNWKAVTGVAGTRTVTDTGVAIATDAWQKLRIEATLSSVKFYIDGVLKATNTTNIPSTGMGLITLFGSDQSKTYYVDYVMATGSVRNN